MAESPLKRQRVDAPEAPRAVCGSFSSSYWTHVDPALQERALADAGLRAGSRIQVLWTIATDEEEEEQVWWSCSIEGAESAPSDGRLAWRVRYDASPELGFDEEVRHVRFGGGCTAALHDAEEVEPMKWRAEPDEHARAEELGALAPGTNVKAHFQGGAKAYAGRVHAVRYDSSSSDDTGPGAVVYDILYEDNVLEEGVPAELVQPTVGAPSEEPPHAAGADIAANSIEQFFELFVRALTGGDVFRRLPAAKQTVFASCVQRSRPHFERELEALARERGYGTTVTARDITETVLPNVMPSVLAAFKQLGAGAA